MSSVRGPISLDTMSLTARHCCDVFRSCAAQAPTCEDGPRHLSILRRIVASIIKVRSFIIILFSVVCKPSSDLDQAKCDAAKRISNSYKSYAQAEEKKRWLWVQEVMSSVRGPISLDTMSLTARHCCDVFRSCAAQAPTCEDGPRHLSILRRIVASIIKVRSFIIILFSVVCKPSSDLDQAKCDAAKRISNSYKSYAQAEEKKIHTVEHQPIPQYGDNIGDKSSEKLDQVWALFWLMIITCLSSGCIEFCLTN